MSKSHNELQALIDDGFENRAEISPGRAPAELRDAVEQALRLIESGDARVAEPGDGGWVVNQWL